MNNEERNEERNENRAMDPGDYTIEHTFDECRDGDSTGSTCPEYMHCKCGLPYLDRMHGGPR